MAMAQAIRRRRPPLMAHRNSRMRARGYLRHIKTLEHYVNQSGEKGRRVLEGLCELLETGTASLSRHRHPLVSRPTSALHGLMEEDGFALPAAIYESLRYECDWERAFRSRRVSKKLEQKLRKLTARAGREIGYWQRTRPPAGDWRAEVDGAREEIEIWIGQDAMEDILAVSLEGYLVSAGPGKPFTEVYATCFGSMKEEKFSNAETGIWYTRHFHVDKILPQIRIKATPASVLPSQKTFEEAHLKVAASVFPHLTYLGDFHTHPYAAAAGIVRFKLWKLTREDRDYTISNMPTMLELGCRDRVMLILALGRSRRVAGRKSLPDHVQPFKVGPCVCYLAGYRVLDNGRVSSERIRLHCPSRSL